jgi:tetratricopeptide (TPR) repeat protein
MHVRAKAIAALGLAAAAFVARPALAGPKGQKSEADRLFDEGAALMKQNKFAEACAKFAESNRLDPEIGGLLWLADCYSRNGQTASAYETYKAAQRMAVERHDRKHRETVAQKHMDEIEPHLTKLTVIVPKDMQVTGLEVQRDGKQIQPSDFGLAIAVDPGVFSITATAPGYEHWQRRVDATGDGQQAKITVGPLQKIFVAQPAPPPAETNDPAFAYHVGGIVTGSAGLVALGVGSAFGLIAGAKLKDSNSTHCDAADTCDAVGLQLRSEAKDAALASTILFVAGGVALAAGITIFFLAPHKKKSTGAVFGRLAPAVGPGFYGASFAGSF